MIELYIRKAENNEIDLMTNARVEYCMREVQSFDQQDYNDFYNNVKEWTIQNVSKGNYIGYFGYQNTDLVCFAGLLMYELPPVFNNFNRKQGYVLSFFTYPKFRNKGYGKELMNFIVNDARETGISELVLKATNEGEPLYRKKGFVEPNMVYMEKKLNG